MARVSLNDADMCMNSIIEFLLSVVILYVIF